MSFFDLLEMLAWPSICAAALYLLRVEVVYHARRAQMDFISGQIDRDLAVWGREMFRAAAHGTPRPASFEGSPYWLPFTQGASFDRQVWQLTKWTRAQFYPETQQ